MEGFENGGDMSGFRRLVLTNLLYETILIKLPFSCSGAIIIVIQKYELELYCSHDGSFGKKSHTGCKLLLSPAGRPIPRRC